MKQSKVNKPLSQIELFNLMSCRTVQFSEANYLRYDEFNIRQTRTRLGELIIEIYAIGNNEDKFIGQIYC